MKLSELIERFDRARAAIRPSEAEQMYAELYEVLDRWDVETPKCELCKGTGIATVVTSPPHIAPARTKEIMCPSGCNKASVEDTIARSRDIMIMESAPIFEAARNPDMPPGWKEWKREGQ